MVFSTRGGSGGNRLTRERGPALTSEREIEAREACAKLGISNVWFLDGKDTPSQNLLDSLANWGHGANLEKLIGLIRLTRPEVIFTHYPGFFVGENHGDHQATGVLVTEAFDLAADPLVFPSQLAGDTKHYEWLLSNLQPWQSKKIYFASEADNSKQFDGNGPTYSVREISPSQKKPYWRLALESGMSHHTQFPEEIERYSKMTDEELHKAMSDPSASWWSEPQTLIFGKSVAGGSLTDEVFAHIDATPAKQSPNTSVSCGNSAEAAGALKLPRAELGGAWLFYSEFYPAHDLCHMKVAKVPEIAVKSGKTLVIPLAILHDSAKTLPVKITASLPPGWRAADGTGTFLLPAESSTSLAVHIDTPALAEAALKKAEPQEVRIHVEAEGKPAGEVKLLVLLRAGALPQ